MRQKSLCSSSQCFLLPFSDFLEIAASELKDGAAQVGCPTPVKLSESFRHSRCIHKEWVNGGGVHKVSAVDADVRQFPHG